MMEKIYFFRVPGEPVSWRAPTIGISRRHGKPILFRNPRTDAYERLVSFLVREKEPGVFIDKPVHLTIVAIFPRPKAMMRFSKRNHGLLLGRYTKGRIYHTSKPDATNIQKAVEDALVRSGFLRDDRLVAVVRTEKYYAALDEEPGTEIAVEVLNE